MAKLRLPTVLRFVADGQAGGPNGRAQSCRAGRRVAAALPALAERICDRDGHRRQFVTVFVDGENARYLDAGTPRSDVQLLPAISGGV